jgi:hypothetical protein
MLYIRRKKNKGNFDTLAGSRLTIYIHNIHNKNEMSVTMKEK